MGSDFQRTNVGVLVAAVFMLWDNWQVYNGKPSFFGAPETVQTTEGPKVDNSVEAVAASGADAVAKGMIQASHPVEVQSDLLKLNIDSKGAVVTRAELLKERQEAEWTEVGLAGMILGRRLLNSRILSFLMLISTLMSPRSGMIGGDFPTTSPHTVILVRLLPKSWILSRKKKLITRRLCLKALRGM